MSELGARLSVSGSARYLAIAIVAASVAVSYGQEARAQDSEPSPDSGYAPSFGQSFASDDDVENAVGNLNIVISTCDPSADANQRAAYARLEKPNFESAPVLNSILFRIAQTVWARCPVELRAIGGSDGRLDYSLARADIYLPDGTLAFQAWELNDRNGSAFSAGTYRWSYFTNHMDERRQQAAQAAAPEADSGWTYVWDGVAIIIDLLFLWLIGWGLYALRIPVARWYYFNFHPHPAEAMVVRAMRAGSVLDGPLLASALGELPPTGSILAKVRIEQGERLVLRMQDMSQAKVREYQKRAMKDYERAALLSMQEAIALAAAALERAKAVFRASESVGR